MTFNFNVYHSLQKFLAVCLHLYCFQYILIASDFGFCQSRLKHFAEDNPDFELLSGSKHFLLLKTKKWGFDFQKDIFYSLFLLDVFMMSQKQSMGLVWHEPWPLFTSVQSGGKRPLKIFPLPEILAFLSKKVFSILSFCCCLSTFTTPFQATGTNICSQFVIMFEVTYNLVPCPIWWKCV